MEVNGSLYKLTSTSRLGNGLPVRPDKGWEDPQIPQRYRLVQPTLSYHLRGESMMKPPPTGLLGMAFGTGASSKKSGTRFCRKGSAGATGSSDVAAQVIMAASIAWVFFFLCTSAIATSLGGVPLGKTEYVADIIPIEIDNLGWIKYFHCLRIGG